MFMMNKREVMQCSQGNQVAHRKWSVE